MIGQVEGSPFGNFRRLDARIPLEKVRLLAPLEPSKIICIGRNYSSRAKEQVAELPEVPLIFLKPPSTLVGHEGIIQIPPQTKQVEHEAELGVVIGRRGRWITPEDAIDYIFGYTIGNDITARDLQSQDGQWTRAKGFDSFCPLGPWVETDFDPNDALISCYVNGEMRQMASTRDMIFSIRQLVAFVSSVMTLEAGDILLTGTPAGVGPIFDGDIIEITIEGIGTLRNFVRSEVSH